MMRNYRVKAGVHVEDDRKYKKDEIVASERPLTTLFAEKFEDLGPTPEGFKTGGTAIPKKAALPTPKKVGKEEFVKDD